MTKITDGYLLPGAVPADDVTDEDEAIWDSMAQRFPTPDSFTPEFTEEEQALIDRWPGSPET